MAAGNRASAIRGTTRQGAGQWGSILDQIVDEASAYADDYVTLEIVNLVKAGTQVTTSEVVLFQVNVSNAGPMQMTQVTVLLEGRNGAQVRAQGSYEDSAESDVYPTIEAHDASGDRGKVPTQAGA